MNTRLTRALSEAVDNYNDYAGEYEQLYWWDVLNEIADMTDEEEVTRIILRIDRETEKLMRKEAAGY